MHSSLTLVDNLISENHQYNMTYQVRYIKHGIIPNESTLWKICEANDDINNDLIKRPTYRKKKRLTYMSYYIGDFH